MMIALSWQVGLMGEGRSLIKVTQLTGQSLYLNTTLMVTSVSFQEFLTFLLQSEQ